MSSHDIIEIEKGKKLNDSQAKMMSYDGDLTQTNIAPDLLKKRTRRARK
jgi:hypothetical protein